MAFGHNEPRSSSLSAASPRACFPKTDYDSCEMAPVTLGLALAGEGEEKS